MRPGYIKVSRELLGSPVFGNEKLLKVWIWCLLKAAHKEHEQMIGMQKVLLRPGQFVFGRKKAAYELAMSESTVWRLMNLLKTDNSLDIKTNNKYSVITLINWGFYQGAEENVDNKMDSNLDSRWTTDEQQMDTNKNVKNDKKLYINPIIPRENVQVGAAENSPESDGAQRKTTGRAKTHEYTAEFEAFWALYPRAADKYNAYQKFAKCLKDGVPLEEIMAATRNYAAKMKGTPEDKILHAKTFLGPAQRYKEYVRGVGLFGRDTGGDQEPAPKATGAEPNWDSFYE